jgi:hypothetical protein
MVVVVLEWLGIAVAVAAALASLLTLLTRTAEAEAKVRSLRLRFSRSVEKAAIWAAVFGGGALLALLGARAAGNPDSDSGVGMIVFGLLIVSVGLSGLLGVLHDEDATGLGFAFLGLFVPGYSLPFLLYYAAKGSGERAERNRRAREREEEFAAGTRCRQCWRRIPGEHGSR